jgi:hypothetical protein
MLPNIDPPMKRNRPRVCEKQNDLREAECCVVGQVVHQPVNQHGGEDLVIFTVEEVAVWAVKGGLRVCLLKYHK